MIPQSTGFEIQIGISAFLDEVILRKALRPAGNRAGLAVVLGLT